MIEHIGGVHGLCLANDCCGHQHDCCHNDHEHFLVNDALSSVDDLYDTLMTHISRKSIHTPKDEIIKLINDSIDEALNSINDRDYLTIEEVRLEFNKLIKKLNFLTEVPEEYITDQELKEILDQRLGTINNSKYCTLSQVEGLLVDYAKISDLSAYAKKSDISNFTYGLSISGSTLSIVKNGGYNSVSIPTSGNGNNLYVLPVATSNALGGIKVGYVNSGKNYAVKLDSNNNAFVTVPWENGISGGSTVTISDTLSSGTPIAKITIDGTSTVIKAPTGGTGDGSGSVIYPIETISAFSNTTTINRDEEKDCPTGWFDSISKVSGKPIYMVQAKKRDDAYVKWSDNHIWTEPVEIVSDNAISSLLAFSSSETLNKNEEKDCPTGWHTSIAEVTGNTIYMTLARKKGNTYLKWTNNNIWSDPIKVFNANTENPGTPGSPNVVVIDESNFDPDNYLPGVLYILMDGNGHVIKMFKDGVWTYVNSSGYCSFLDWNNIHINENNNVFYVITDANGTIIGYGLNGVFMSIPIPADGTIVTLTKDQYDQLVEDGLMVATTMYAITDENGNVLYFMLAGKVIPIGEDGNTEAIESQLTTLFSLKFGVEVDNNGNWRVSNLTFSKVDVDTPGMASFVTGFENYINKETYTGGMITKSNAELALAELFASYVKNDDSAIASVKSFVENDLADVQTVATLQKENKIVTASTRNHVNDSGADITMSVAYVDKDLHAKTADLKLEVGEDSKVSINADHINFNADQISAVAQQVDVLGLLYAKDSLFIGGEDESHASSQFVKNGSGYVAKGNISWKENGDVTVNANGTFNGTIYANNGQFNGIVNASDGSFRGSVKATSLEVVEGDETVIKIAQWTNEEASNNTDTSFPVGTPIIRAWFNGLWYYTDLRILKTGDGPEINTIVCKKINSNSFINVNDQISYSDKIYEQDGIYYSDISCTNRFGGYVITSPMYESRPVKYSEADTLGLSDKCECAKMQCLVLRCSEYANGYPQEERYIYCAKKFHRYSQNSKLQIESDYYVCKIVEFTNDIDVWSSTSNPAYNMDTISANDFDNILMLDNYCSSTLNDVDIDFNSIAVSQIDSLAEYDINI